ncbi:OmpA family protein [bacterium]|nr:OmpA family protein [bacterium]
MSKKKAHAEEHVNHERWLVSYADFITLLFAFFVVLFSSSAVEHSKTNKSGLAIEAAFDSFSIFKEPSGDSFEPSDKGGAGGNAQRNREVLVVSDNESSRIAPAQVNPKETSEKIIPKGDPALNQNTGFLTPPDDIVSDKHKELLELIDARKWNQVIAATIDDRGLVITVDDSIIFEPGTIQLTSASRDFLESLGKLLKDIPNQVKVEGYIDEAGKISSPLDLSMERALFVIQWLSTHYSINGGRFIASSFVSAEEAHKNQIEIIVLSKDAEAIEAPVTRNVAKDVKQNQPVNVPTNLEKHPLVNFKQEVEDDNINKDRERNNYNYVPPVKF